MNLTIQWFDALVPESHFTLFYPKIQQSTRAHKVKNKILLTRKQSFYSFKLNPIPTYIYIYNAEFNTTVISVRKTDDIEGNEFYSAGIHLPSKLRLMY